MQLLTKIVSLHLILIKQPCLFSTESTFNRLYEIDKTVNSTVGFVPTMGALHQGHLALMQQSLLANENTVVNILLTTQFNNPRT
jgi:pantothenate synthetase